MLVSIIIPSTGRRPALLNRAIQSALIDDENITIEILVILNGIEGLAFDIESAFQHSLVTYYKVNKANVSYARNFGLSIATGDLIRFLDDDDFLYPDIATKQYKELFLSNSDLSTYSGAIEDDNIRYQVIKPINIDDYCSAIISATCPALTFATVYKYNLIKELKWDERISVVEDEKWMRTVAIFSEVKWIRSDDVVAVWYQHDVDRLSFSIPNFKHFFYRTQSILEVIDNLGKNNRLTEQRSIFAAQGLWSSIHNGFYFSPVYWTQIALYARKLDPTSKPQEKFFHKLPDFIHPIVVEWLMLPKRWLTHQLRILRKKLGLISYIRKL